MKKYGVCDDWNGLIEEYDSLEEAEKLYNSVKDSRMSEGVDINDTFVSIVESDDDFENEKEIKKSIVEVDEELTKEIGTPNENGYEWTYWAKWKEII